MRRVWLDKIRRKMFADAEIQRRALKSITMSSKLPMSIRQAAQQQLQQLPHNTCPSRIRMRCVLTGRPRGVCKDTGLSRIMFRLLASRGDLPGVWKAR